MSQIKQNLLGIFEITLFMESGVDRFAFTRTAALQSFFLPLLMIPAVLFAKILLSPADSPPPMLALYTLQIILTLGLFLGVVFLVCKHCARSNNFYRFVTIINWFNIAMLIMILPIIVSITLGFHGAEYFQNYALFITMLSYVYTAFIVTHVLRIPWELGAFLGIMGMCIDQTALGVTGQLQGILNII